jgi:hypothetical protein
MGALRYTIPGGMFRVLELKCTKWTVISGSWGLFITPVARP